MGGEGGTGKSQVIKAIIEYFLRDKIKNQLLVSAPTGSAACLINRETIHRLMKLTIHNKNKNKSASIKIRKLQSIWKNVKFLIMTK